MTVGIICMMLRTVIIIEVGISHNGCHDDSGDGVDDDGDHCHDHGQNEDNNHGHYHDYNYDDDSYNDVIDGAQWLNHRTSITKHIAPP